MLDVDISTTLEEFTLAIQARIYPGEVTAIFGPSGSGKTTLLRCVAGFEKPEGRIALDEHVWLDSTQHRFVPPHQRRLGYVAQDAALFPHLDVNQNLDYAQRRAPPDSVGSPLTRDALIDVLDLAPLLHRDTRQLSGGESQRVALARALLTQPRMLLLDEPFAGLDRTRRNESLSYIDAVCRQMSIGALFVSHVFEEVVALAPQTILVNQGRVTAAGSTAELFANPELRRTARREVLGSVLVVAFADWDPHYQLAWFETQGQRLAVPVARKPQAGSTSMYIMARDVSIALGEPRDISIRNVLRGRVAMIDAADWSALVDVTIDVGDQQLLSRVTRAAADALNLTPGKEVFALIKSVSFDPGLHAGRRQQDNDPNP